MHLAKNQANHYCTKYIDVRFHFIREIIDEGDIILEKICITRNSVDMMTKVVIRVKFQHFLDLINLHRS